MPCPHEREEMAMPAVSAELEFGPALDSEQLLAALSDDDLALFLPSPTLPAHGCLGLRHVMA